MADNFKEHMEGSRTSLRKVKFLMGGESFTGYFHQWCVISNELIAIVELPNGKITQLPYDQVILE